MQKKGKIICILIASILSTIIFGIEANQSGDPTLFIISSIALYLVSGIVFLIYHYVTKDIIDSKFTTKNT